MTFPFNLCYLLVYGRFLFFQEGGGFFRSALGGGLPGGDWVFVWDYCQGFKGGGLGPAIAGWYGVGGWYRVGVWCGIGGWYGVRRVFRNSQKNKVFRSGRPFGHRTDWT